MCLIKPLENQNIRFKTPLSLEYRYYPRYRSITENAGFAMWIAAGISTSLII